MPQNRVQMQKGQSFHEFMSAYPDEDACLDALVKSRWPDGYRCPRCGGHQHSLVSRRNITLYQCSQCRTQTSPTAGTLFADTKLSLKVWFLALYMLVQNKNNVSALELKRHLGVCYRTAWRLKHKLMEAMASQEQRRKLGGLVQVDDAYLGGEKMGGKPGRGSPNKQAFIAAVSVNGPDVPMHGIFYAVQSFTKKEVASFAARHLQSGSDVVTDGLGCFRAFEEGDFAHSVVVAKNPRLAAKSETMRWVNTILGNLKRAMGGTYHSIKVFKYSQRYLYEYAWRFNRRFDLASIVGELLSAAAAKLPTTERALRCPASNPCS